MNRILVLGMALVAAHQTGCASARYVQRDTEGGVVAIPDKSNAWPSYNRNKAEELIREHVGTDYEVVEEWAAKTDPPPKPERNAATNTPLIVLPSEGPWNATGQLVEATEWRIRYRKRTPGSDAATSSGVVPAGHQIPTPALGHDAIIPPPVLPAE